MESEKISPKQFNSFINTEHQVPAESALKVTTSTSIGKMGDRAIRDFRHLIELAKSASRNENSPMADLFYELKELKEQEIGLIYNYIKQE